MSLPEIRRSDSFSIDDQAPQFGKENDSPNQRPSENNERSDSPVFGNNKVSNFQGAMYVDDDFQSVSPTTKAVNHRSISGDPNAIIFELRQKIDKAKEDLHLNQEDYKAQLLHIETINMMTKYQLVFLKLENAITKISNLFRTKHSHFKFFAFSKILKSGTTKEDDLQKYKFQIAYHLMKGNVEGFGSTLKKVQRKPLLNAFKSILLHSKLIKFDKTQKDEREKYSRTYQETMSAKEAEIHEFKKKIEDLNLNLASARSKENELTAKITNKEKQIYALEKERNELLKNGKSGSSQKFDLKSLEEQLYTLQAENEDLKEKLMSAEDNVGSFIREMTDLLDSHELSTNLLSDNNSFNYQDHDDDDKHKDKPSNYYSQPKNSSKDNSKLSSGNQKSSSTKGFSKNLQVNYCFVEYNNPELNQPEISRPVTSLFNRKALHQDPVLDKKKEKSSIPDYEIELIDNVPPMMPTKELDENDIKELFYPKAVKKLTWNQNGGSCTAGPKIVELAGEKKGTSAGRRTSPSERSGGQRGSSRSPQKSMDRSNEKRNDDENDDEEFDEQQVRMLQEAARIQMSLRYVLGLYKLHSLFVESELLTTQKVLAFKNISHEEPRENLIDTKSAEKVKNIHIEALNKNNENSSDSLRSNLISIKLALQDSNITKSDLNEIVTHFEGIIANYERLQEKNHKSREENETRLKDLESKYKSSEGHKKTLETQQKELEAKIKELEAKIRDEDKDSVLSGKSNVSAIKGSGPPAKSAKEEELEKFLVEENQKFDEYEQQLKMKESELVALQQTLETQSMFIQGKEKELQDRIRELRSAPLLVLGDHAALKERLADARGRLFDQYLNETRMKSMELPQDEFVESLKQETEEFWKNVSVETKPSNMKQVIESLKAYETYMIYERAKLEVLEKHLEEEIAGATEEKERFLKENENFTKVNEIYAVLKEESEALDQKREGFNKAKIELNKLVRVLKEVLIKAKLSNDHELSAMTYLDIIIKFKKHTVNREISPSRKSKVKTEDGNQTPKGENGEKSRKSVIFPTSKNNIQSEDPNAASNSVISAQNAKRSEELNSKFIELETLKKALEKEAEILKDERTWIDKIKEEGGLLFLTNRVKQLEEENGQLKREKQGILSDNFFDRERLRANAIMRDSMYLSESPQKRPNQQMKVAEVLYKWLQFTIDKNDNPTKDSVLRNHFIAWKLAADLIVQYQYYGTSGLEKSSWLSSRWDDKKRELTKSGRYPMKKLSKNKREAELMIFDHERKTYWKSKVANLLNSILRNNRKRTRVLMVSAWSRFCFNVAMLRLHATSANLQTTVPSLALTPNQVQHMANQYKFDRTQGLKDPKDAFPNNLSRVPTEKSFDHKVVNIIQQSLDESDVLDEAPIDENQAAKGKDPKLQALPTQSSSRQVGVGARDKTPTNQQPKTKKSTTPVQSKQTGGIQNKENKSTTPNKVTPTKNFSTLAGDSLKVKKFRILSKLLLNFTRESSSKTYRMGMYLYKWRLYCHEVEMQNVLKEFQDIDMVLKEKVGRDQTFREQVKANKQEIENKVATLNHYLSLENRK